MSDTDALLVYRLVKKKWAYNAFDGEGAKRYGGRWNSRRKACVYLGSSESLTLLEVMVHIENYQLLKHYALFQVRLAKTDLLHLDANSLPKNWRDDPAPPETAAIGDGWLSNRASLALAVPSVIVPREWNYLINPSHPDFPNFASKAVELDFSPDARLLGTT